MSRAPYRGALPLEKKRRHFAGAFWLSFDFAARLELKHGIETDGPLM